MGDESCSEGSNPSFSAEHFLMTEWLNVDMVLKSESGSPLSILRTHRFEFYSLNVLL